MDDSTDETPEVIGKLQEWFPLPIKLIARPGRAAEEWIGGAVVEGFQAAQGTWMGVMDADLQHPPEMIPRLLRQAQRNGADIVMGSRLAPGGDSSSLGFTRNIISHVFAWTTRLAFPQRLGKVTDPLTGFFLTRRAALKVEELETGWVQDPVGDPGVAPTVESDGSADPVWASDCGGEQSLAQGDGQVLPRLVPIAAGGQDEFRQVSVGGLVGLGGQQCGVVCLHGAGGDPLCGVGSPGDASLDPVEFWVDGDLGLWQAGDGATVPAAPGEFSAGEQPVAGGARTDHHRVGGSSGRSLFDCQSGVVVGDDGFALSVGGQMDLESRQNNVQLMKRGK